MAFIVPMHYKNKIYITYLFTCYNMTTTQNKAQLNIILASHLCTCV